MAVSSKYPMLQINLTKIYENAKTFIGYCDERHIGVSCVIKGFNGEPKIVDQLVKAGCSYIASSRIEQLTAVKKNHAAIPLMLIRIPMLCELKNLVKHIDVSLNSEWETIKAIEEECRKQDKSHGVVLMYDLGDLREGFFEKRELMDLVLYIENDCKYVKLMGIGTNLSCYGSVKPTAENLGKLCETAVEIEKCIGRKLEIVSGGATTSIPLLSRDEMPAGINHLRVGENILLYRDLPDYWNTQIPGMCQDTFTVKAQVVEVKDKPSYPIGELFIDAFGNKPAFDDRGIRKRAILALGKQDFGQHENLIPLLPGAEIIGSSSDHLIVDVEDCKQRINVGDVLSFGMYYGAMLYLTGSESVRKMYCY